MPRSVTTPIKSCRPQITGDILSSAGHRVILKTRYYSSTSSVSINILEYFPPVPDPDWSLYDEDDYIGKMDALDIHILYTAEINNVASNPSYSINYDTSNPCTVCGKTGHTFGECDLLKQMTS